MRISDWSSDVCSSDLVQSLFFNMAKIAASGRLGQGEEAQAFALPDRVEAIVEREGRTDRVWLDRATDLPDRLTVPAGGFMRARYRTAAAFDETLDGADISIPAWTPRKITIARSEEHTSELQSLMRISYAVFCLKKKNNL